jgi:hypothetical protein
MPREGSPPVQRRDKITRVAFGGSLGIATTSNPPGYRFIAAGGVLDATNTNVTGSVTVADLP